MGARSSIPPRRRVAIEAETGYDGFEPPARDRRHTRGGQARPGRCRWPPDAAGAGVRAASTAARGLMVAAALEDSSYPVDELVWHLANLRGGYRFSGRGRWWWEFARLGSCARIALRDGGFPRLPRDGTVPELWRRDGRGRERGAGWRAKDRRSRDPRNCARATSSARWSSGSACCGTSSTPANWSGIAGSRSSAFVENCWIDLAATSVIPTSDRCPRTCSENAFASGSGIGISNEFTSLVPPGSAPRRQPGGRGSDPARRANHPCLHLGTRRGGGMASRGGLQSLGSTTRWSTCATT